MSNKEYKEATYEERYKIARKKAIKEAQSMGYKGTERYYFIEQRTDDLLGEFDDK
tara:strand:+ start:937 stop:1101 length:165 start_codon:yes stop_codon:yes gene_type:complete